MTPEQRREHQRRYFREWHRSKLAAMTSEQLEAFRERQRAANRRYRAKHRRPRPSTLQRFMAKVSKDAETGCWIWTGHRGPSGYGMITVGAKSLRAHRVSWELFNARPIPDGLHCLHRCDNPACASPFHLWLGTHTDNMHDMIAKGRHRTPGVRGSARTDAKLTEASIVDIRTSSESDCALARKYGVSSSTILKARSGKTWQHVPVAGVPHRTNSERGETHKDARFTVATVKAIRDSALPSAELARTYGVSWHAIDNIRARRTWKHVA